MIASGLGRAARRRRRSGCPTTPASTTPRPAGRERHGRQQRADQGDEERAADAQVDVREAERLRPRSRAAAPRSPRSAPVRSTRSGSWRSPTAPKTPSSNRSYSSTTRCGSGSAHDDPAPEVAQRQEGRRRGRRRRRRRRRRRPGRRAAGRSGSSRSPAARPRTAIANRSRIRSMKTVPNVRLSETGLLILSR